MKLWDNYEDHSSHRSRLWRVTSPDGTVETVRGLVDWVKGKDTHLAALYNYGRSKGYTAEEIDSKCAHDWELTHPDGTVEIVHLLSEAARKYGFSVWNINRLNHSNGYKVRRLYNVR